MEYTYSPKRLAEATAAATALQLSPNKLGWTGVDLHSLQPRILACYAAPCKTAQPFEHFGMYAMQDLPHHFALHVEMAMSNGDRPDMAPYLAMLGNPYTPLPPPPPPPPPPPLLSTCAWAQQAVAAW